ncbi:pre-mRNA-splicing factor 18 [Pseudoscourfieldia marina]
MSSLQALLSQKRKQKEHAYATSNNDAVNEAALGGSVVNKKPKKYMSRAALLKLEEEQQQLALRDSAGTLLGSDADAANANNAASLISGDEGRGGSGAAGTARTKGRIDAGEHASASAREDGKDHADNQGTMSLGEVIRRLRRLGQPATLFGENLDDRIKRLEVAQENIKYDDEALGGQQINVQQLIEREEEEARRREEMERIAKADGDAKAAREKLQQQQHGRSNAGAGAGAATSQEGEPKTEEDRLAAAFAQAAKAAAAIAEEETKAPEEKLLSWLRRKLAEWEADLEARSEQDKATMDGKQATMQLKQSKIAFAPLFEKLETRTLDDDLVRGFSQMMSHMKAGNYMAASDMYVKVAIGNAAWPIGVTSVGIHERKSRERIGSQSSAHIMNDEASRKFLQAMKRMITWMEASEKALAKAARR